MFLLYFFCTLGIVQHVMSQQTQDGEQASLGYCELLASRRARPHRNKAEDSRCSCTPADGCGQGCLNRATYHECDPARCPAGEACTNQRLQQRSGIACSLRYMPGKGWGVVADHPVGQNTLVVEYCGEVVSRAEGTRRAAAYAARGLRHTYIMGLRCVWWCFTLGAFFFPFHSV